MSQMNPDPNEPIAPIVEGAYAPQPYWAPPPPPMPPRSEPHIWRWIAVSIVVAIIAAGGTGVGVGWGLAKALRNQTTVQSPIAIARPTAPSSGNGGSNAGVDVNAIAAKVDPAIVDINTTTGSGQASGTGMILTPDGEILTNNHVVDGSLTISVVIAGHSGNYAAHVVGVAPAADVALIQVDGVSGLPTVTPASSSAVQVGDQIVALGNALGLGGAPSVSTGTVTALDQTITASEGGGKSEQLSGLIESNAPISPGDSGGPIVNSAGQVVGMITAGDVQGFRSQTSTVNYAIPADTAISLVNKIRTGQASSDIIYGQVGLLGVSVRDLTQDVATQLGLSVASGALVVSVQPGSPADSAGITSNSVITNIGGTKVSSSETLGTAIKSHKPGESISVTWVNARGTHTATATLIGVNP
jgi:S1-C subfamily serine protease